jgi:translation elongation factor EF-Ts
MQNTTLSLKTAQTQEVVRTLTKRLDEISANFPRLIDLHDLSLNGIALTEKEMIRIVENLRDDISYSVVRGHIRTDFANVTYSDQKYFSYERIDKSISSNDMLIRIDKFKTFRMFVSENNWIDLYFEYSGGDSSSYITMVIIP